ncbi:MAG: ferrous iron transport protein B [bacterium]
MTDNRGKDIFIALAGNPNSGKTTIFNSITGARHHVGNYPGVTVERKEGELTYNGRRLRVIDLPGTYSLSAYSPDERVARRVILEEQPDVVVQIVDAGNLERNLYLAVQLIAMKIPVVLAFNMMDEVKKRGIKIDLEQLSVLLGVPIVPTVGNRGEGISELLDGVIEVAESGEGPRVKIRFGSELDRGRENILEALSGLDLSAKYAPEWISIKLLEADPEVISWLSERGEKEVLEKAERERERIKDLLGDDPEILLADARYGWLHGAVAETMRLTVEDRRTISDKVDTVVANRVLGLPIFFFVMWLTFYITFKLGDPMAGLVHEVFQAVGGMVSSALPAGLLRSLLVDGVIAGVGGVVMFLPNIMLLFFMVSLMEDSGYMARAAFIVDRVMHLVGLHGKSFIPLFLGFGCNVPAIMGARILENERDRRATIMVSPFISCSARLPVYVLFAGAFFGANAGHVIFSLYLLGIVVAMVMARVLRVYVIRGEPTPFVMELPPYRLPTAKSVLVHMWERAWMYLKKAGTIILAMSIVVWFLSNFPADVDYTRDVKEGIARHGSVESLPDDMRVEASKQRMEASYAGMAGRAIEPVLEPAGLGDWKVSIALLTGLVAKEVVVSTMSTIYSMGETGAESPKLQETIKQDPFFSQLRAYVFLVFVLLYIPCLATVVVAYRELGSWRWAAAMLVMTIATAYVTSAAVWWLGKLAGLG